MNPERANEVQRSRWMIGLLDNLKTFLARLFSDFNRMLKVNIWSVKVENLPELPEQIDTRDHLLAILQSIKEIPTPEKTDMKPVCDMLQMLIDKPEMEFPTQDNSMLAEAIKAVEKAITGMEMPSMPEIKMEKPDYSKIEKLLADIAKLLTPPPMPKMTKAKEAKLPVWQSEELVYNRDNELTMIINHYDTQDIIEKRVENWNNGVRTLTWTEETVNVK